LEDLAAKTEITASALQSHEAGLSRFSAKELLRIAQCLNVEVSFFFEGLARTRERPLSPSRINVAGSNAEPPRSRYLPRFDVGIRRGEGMNAKTVNIPQDPDRRVMAWLPVEDEELTA